MIEKMAILMRLLRLKHIRADYAYWRREVWAKDLDGLYCCNGYECGCMGVTVREVFQND